MFRIFKVERGMIMELDTLYVLEVNGHKHYFATPYDRASYVNLIWRNHPTISIVKYEIKLE